MKRKWKAIASMLVVMLVSSAVDVSSSADQVMMICFTYYSDSSFTTIVGAWSSLCDGSLNTSGVKSSYRYYFRMNCLHGGIIENCQQSNGTGGWDIIPCPGGMTDPVCLIP